MAPRRSTRSSHRPRSPRSSRKGRSSPPANALPPCPEVRRKGGGPVPEEIRRYALTLLVSGFPAPLVAERIGVSKESLRLWRRRAERDGTLPPPLADANGSPQGSSESSPAPSRSAVPQRAPHDPAQGLSAVESEAILSLKKRHPSMGPAQIRAQLKRFKGWRLSVRAIARVLTHHGYELVHVGSRPQGQETPSRWEAPHRNAVWQMDFAELRVGPEKVALLLVLDDFSRFIVGHELMTEVSSEGVVDLVQAAISRHGKPEAVYTDRGGPFLAWNKPSSFGAFLERELIDHHVSPPYRPMGRGKIEALVATIRRELWDIVHFDSTDEARHKLSRFIRHYNHGRAHMSLDGLTPADRFHGRWEEIKERVEAVSRKRQGALLASSPASIDPFVTEEALSCGPVEVLRLVVVDGRMEIRFLGHRVDLGRIKP